MRCEHLRGKLRLSSGHGLQTCAAAGRSTHRIYAERVCYGWFAVADVSCIMMRFDVTDAGQRGAGTADVRLLGLTAAVATDG